MTFIKKQQKWIVLLVVFTFMWLLQVSILPVAAASNAEQISSADNEQGPHFIEKEENSGYRAKKSSALPFILGVVVVSAVVVFLIVLQHHRRIESIPGSILEKPNWKYTDQKIVITGAPVIKKPEC